MHFFTYFLLSRTFIFGAGVHSIWFPKEPAVSTQILHLCPPSTYLIWTHTKAGWTRYWIWVFKKLEFKCWLSCWLPQTRSTVYQSSLPAQQRLGLWPQLLVQESNKYSSGYAINCNKKTLSSFLGTPPQPVRILFLKLFKTRSATLGLWEKSTVNPSLSPHSTFILHCINT